MTRYDDGNSVYSKQAAQGKLVCNLVSVTLSLARIIQLNKSWLVCSFNTNILPFFSCEIASREEIYYADEIHRFGVCTYPERRLRIIKNIKNWKKYLPERERVNFMKFKFIWFPIHMLQLCDVEIFREFSSTPLHMHARPKEFENLWVHSENFKLFFPENFAGCKVVVRGKIGKIVMGRFEFSSLS